MSTISFNTASTESLFANNNAALFGGFQPIDFSPTDTAQLNINEPSQPLTEPEQLAATGDLDAAVEFMNAQPDQIDALLQAYSQQRPGAIPDLLEAGGEVVASHLADEMAKQSEPSLGNRLWGGLRAVGGGIESIVGGAIVLAPEPTGLSIAGGGILAIHGADNFQAGLRQAWTGREVDSFTQEAGETVALAFGADAKTAEWIGIGTDIGVGLAGSGLVALSRLSAQSATVWGSINATQPVHAGTVIPRSFTLSTAGENVWVAGNASKHIADDAVAHLGRGVSQDLVRVGSQIQLSSLQAAVGSATANGVPYNQLIRAGGWELVFRPARNADDLPALVHALPIR